MRVLLSKSYRPSICFSKSSLCIYSPCTLKLEDVHHVSSSSAPVPEAVEGKSSEGRIEVKDVKADILLKSILKKSAGSGKKEAGKGRVKWMDFVGKELAETREFEPFDSRESEDIGSASSQTCICAIQ